MDTAIPVGALIGVIASLVGTWAAYRLLVAKEVRQRHAELKDALRLVKIELTSQSAVLTSSGADTRVDCTAYEALKARALLASLPTDLATQIVRAYLLLARMNEARQDRDNTWYGLVAAG